MTKNYQQMFASIGNESRPKVLVLEALSGSSSCVSLAHGLPDTVKPTDPHGVAAALRRRPKALVLTGGSDVNPELYGEEPDKSVYGINPLRDSVESLALDAANDMGIPVLGICRGSQMMNVWAGGSLWQDIGQAHWGTEHKIVTERDSLARHALGYNPRVASFHHQEVKETGKGFRISAWSKDEHHVIEAIESDNGRMLGVQFHPEMRKNYEHSRRVFSWLVDAARGCEPMPCGTDILKRLEALEPPRPPRPPKMSKAQRAAATAALKASLRAKHKATVIEDPWDEESHVCTWCGMAFEDIADRLDHEDILHARKLSELDR